MRGPLNISQYIAHRGASAAAPENTIASLREAHKQGMQWVECDVMLTKDHQPIIMHDDTLNRTTNGFGKVSRKTFSELVDLDAGAGQHIPLLRHWLIVAGALGLHLNIEIKEKKLRAKVIAEIIYRELQRYWSQRSMLLISSGELACLKAYRQFDQEVPMALIVSRLPLGWKRKLAAINASAIVIHYRALTVKRVKHIHAMGYKVLAYTVNDAVVAKQLFKMGVDSIFSDDCLRVKVK